MTLDEVHLELTQLGVSSEVHALVDDLELYPRVPPLAFDLFRKPRKQIDIPKNVYTPHTSLQEVQGRFDEDYNRPLWQVRECRAKNKANSRHCQFWKRKKSVVLHFLL